MIALSGYTGKSAENVRDRLIASNELKSSKIQLGKKCKIEYSTQTMVMGSGFSVIPEGLTKKHIINTVVPCKDSFETYVVGVTKEKHKKPQIVKSGNKYTVFSKLDDGMLYVDMLEFSCCSN